MNLEGIKLYVATPCFGGNMHVGYVHSLLATQQMLNDVGIPTFFGFIPGDSLINRARNVLVAQFMASDYTHFLFIDADIQWDARSILRLISASGQEDIEVCCGIYPKKCIPTQFPVNFMAGSTSAINHHPKIPYVEIRDAPTGFLMIRRDAFLRMMEAYPERKCVLRQDQVPGESRYEYALFDCFIDDDGRYLSEDFGFSRLWQKIGGKIWMDPTIKLIHHGHYAYDGKISDILTAADDSERPKHATEIDGWMSADELHWLSTVAQKMSSVIEIGCWKGRSTFALLAGCKGTVHAVDHWQGSEGERDGAHIEAKVGDVYSQFLKNVSHFPNLLTTKKPSIEAAEELDPADMVFIDAGHTYDEVRADIRAWRGKARKILAGHDYNWTEVARAVTDELGEVQLGVGSIWFKEVA